MVTHTKVSAPLRIDFCGGYSDLPVIVDSIGCSILNIAIDLYGDIKRKNRLNFHLAYYKKSQVKDSTDIDNCSRFFSLEAYLKFSGYIFICSEIPLSSGLGTSSSLCVMASYLNKIKKDGKLYIYKKCLLNSSFVIEKEILKVNGGVQDHIAALNGGINFINVKDNSIVIRAPIKRNVLCDYIDHNAILLFSPRAFSSTIIVEDIIKNFKSNHHNIKIIKNLNEKLYDCITNSNDIYKLFEIIKESWKYRIKLSNLAKNKNLDFVINSIEENLYCYHSTGAGGAIMVIYPMTSKMSIVNAKLKQYELKGIVKCYYPKINWSGVNLC